MKIIIHPNKLAEMLQQQPQLLSELTPVLEQALSHEDHAALCHRLLNAQVATKTQSSPEAEPPIFA
jgi:hypothetical protein